MKLDCFGRTLNPKAAAAATPASNRGSRSYFCSRLVLVNLKLVKIQTSLGFRFFLRWYFKHPFTFSDEFATQTSWSHKSTKAEACAVVSLGLRTWNQPSHSQLQTEDVIECANEWLMGSFGQKHAVPFMTDLNLSVSMPTS